LAEPIFGDVLNFQVMAETTDLKFFPIAKGQSFFLLKGKCAMIADRLNVKLNDYVLSTIKSELR
jgi:uncharacterized protein with ATP-grasp and redox domains